jgi:hypothetical protein
MGGKVTHCFVDNKQKILLYDLRIASLLNMTCNYIYMPAAMFLIAGTI